MPIGNSFSGAYNALGVDMKLKRRIEALEQAHNGLCDVLDAMLTYVRPNMQADYHKAIRTARIGTGDTEALREHWQKTQPTIISESDMEATLGGRYIKPQEAQDEPQSSKDVSDGRDSTPPMVSTGGAEVESVSVDAIMGELREASAKRFIPEVTYSVKRFIDLDVRPHIEKLVGEIRLKNIFLRGKEGCEQEMIKAIEAKELAEAEVARLRDLLKRMPHLSEMHEGYVNLVEKALAKYETQKGGNDEQAVRNATLEEVANYISSAWLNAKSNIEIAKIVRQMKESS